MHYFIIPSVAQLNVFQKLKLLEKQHTHRETDASPDPNLLGNNMLNSFKDDMDINEYDDDSDVILAKEVPIHLDPADNCATMSP